MRLRPGREHGPVRQPESSNVGLRGGGAIGCRTIAGLSGLAGLAGPAGPAGPAGLAGLAGTTRGLGFTGGRLRAAGGGWMLPACGRTVRVRWARGGLLRSARPALIGRTRTASTRRSVRGASRSPDWEGAFAWGPVRGASRSSDRESAFARGSVRGASRSPDREGSATVLGDVGRCDVVIAWSEVGLPTRARAGAG